MQNYWGKRVKSWTRDWCRFSEDSKSFSLKYSFEFKRSLERNVFRRQEFESWAKEFRERQECGKSVTSSMAENLCRPNIREDIVIVEQIIWQSPNNYPRNWVPRILTTEQREKRVEVCSETSPAIRGRFFLESIPIYDETWETVIILSRIKECSAWKHIDSLPPLKAKVASISRKV